MKIQPRTPGVRREQKSSCMHAEVVRNLQSIAKAEGKSLSWVVAEIVYDHFGLKIDEHTVKVLRRKYRKKNVLAFRKVG
jgi:hypothetical protein